MKRKEMAFIFSEYENIKIQFLFNELQKLHPRMNGEYSSVLEVFSLGKYPTVAYVLGKDSVCGSHSPPLNSAGLYFSVKQYSTK